jgi:uncharacterized protein YdgA (DUF945 family)
VLKMRVYLKYGNIFPDRTWAVRLLAKRNVALLNTKLDINFNQVYSCTADYSIKVVPWKSKLNREFKLSVVSFDLQRTTN